MYRDGIVCGIDWVVLLSQQGNDRGGASQVRKGESIRENEWDSRGVEGEIRVAAGCRRRKWSLKRTQFVLINHFKKVSMVLLQQRPLSRRWWRRLPRPSHPNLSPEDSLQRRYIHSDNRHWRTSLWFQAYHNLSHKIQMLFLLQIHQTIWDGWTKSETVSEKLRRESFHSGWVLRCQNWLYVLPLHEWDFKWYLHWESPGIILVLADLYPLQSECFALPTDGHFPECLLAHLFH